MTRHESARVKVPDEKTLETGHSSINLVSFYEPKFSESVECGCGSFSHEAIIPSNFLFARKRKNRRQHARLAFVEDEKSSPIGETDLSNLLNVQCLTAGGPCPSTVQGSADLCR